MFFIIKYVKISFMNKYILGSIRKIIFESNSGPYKVGLFKVKETNDEELSIYVDKVIGFTGSFNEINSDLEYILYGELFDHPKYGIQYNVSSYEIKEPSDIDSLILYLSSGMFKGIGEKTAKKIVERFGNDTLDVIKNNYESLTVVSGMSISKARSIHDKVVNSELNQDLILKLNSYGFSVKEAIDLITIYGYELSEIVEDNIYELVDYVSFDKLDLIFLKTHEEMHSYRIEALIKHLIYVMCYESGDSLIYKDELFIRLKRYFNDTFDSDRYIIFLNKLIDNNEIVEIDGYVTLYDFYDAEKYILTSINRLNNIKNVIKQDKLDDYISRYEKDNNIKFDSCQKEAIKGSIINNFYIITGGPGTGKTTIIRAIVHLIEKIHDIKKNDIVLLAPTGRSAKRMCESVGLSAYTIHKFLKWNKETETFQVDEYNKAKEKVVIVDESSMVDIMLFSSLLKGLRINVKLILVGDANQLPSIGPGDVLNNLLMIDNIKSKYLTNIYRAKKDSYIIDLANDIKDKKFFDKFDNFSDFKFIDSDDDSIVSYVKEICNKVKKKNISLDNFQVLVPMYKTINGIDNLNRIMADIFNDNKKYQVGEKYYRVNDKVIQLVNDVDNNVYNGDIGYIDGIEYIDKKLVININYMGNIVTYKSGEFDRFNLAYAISIHKSQGSEYDNVVIVLSRNMKRMFYNKLIYTAVTRAKKSLIIIGSIDSLNSAVETLYANNRKTYLKMHNL